MELIASLRDQLAELCSEPSIDPNWILIQLSRGLRQRYGRVALGFVRRRIRDPAAIQLLGLADGTGAIVVPLPGSFQPDDRHPSARAADVPTEAWIDPSAFGAWHHAAVDRCLAASRAAFVTPWLIDRPADWHILVLSPIAPPGGMSQDRGLSVTANLLATNLLRALDARRLVRANAWIEREMDEIAHLQALLQPDRDPGIAGLDIAFSSEIYQYAGGDYFDLPRLTHLVEPAERVPGRDHWGVIIADVSGHGPSAAVEAAMLDAILRTYPGPVGRGPAAVAGYVNRHLFTRRPRAAFVSAFIANFDPGRETLRYVSCGHPAPLLRRADGATEELPVDTGIPLRIDREATWSETERAMGAGELLVLFTDGILETRSPAGAELGRAGLAAILERTRAGATASETLAALRTGILAHRRGGCPQDDETVIVLRFGV